MPLGFRLTYAPDLLQDVFVQWAKNGYPEELPDIEAHAWRNQSLRNDLNYFLTVVDYVATNKK